VSIPAKRASGDPAISEPSPADAGPQKAMRRRLRAERERRGLSVRGLAAEVGISASALSQIETGRSRPSVMTLYAIVSALGLSFDGLFAGGPGPPIVDAPSAPASRRVFVRRAGEGESIEFTSGVLWDRMNPPGDIVDALWLTYPAGAASGEAGQFMRHSGHEYGILISGRLGVSVGFETYELAPGDAISFPSTAPHRLEALGEGSALAIWFVLPGGRLGGDREGQATSNLSSRPSRHA
jgi:transcriptional regulator with XRE-family HTH domain